MNPNKARWEKGDFTAIAALMRPSGEALVKSLPLKLPARVLDLGCGDGTTAVPLAQLGADVTGIDIAQNLVAAGNQRAMALGLRNLKFQEGDACNLQGVADGNFDLTLTVFGAMFAPKTVRRREGNGPRHQARRSHRDGQLDSPRPDLLRVTGVEDQLGVHAAAARGIHQSDDMGVESHILERFAQAGVAKDRVAMARDTFYFGSPEVSPAQLIDIFRHFYGPTMNAFDAAEKNGKADELHRLLLAETTAHNKAPAGTHIPATFMRVTVSR